MGEKKCLARICGRNTESVWSQKIMSDFGEKLLESMRQAVDIAKGTVPKSGYTTHTVEVVRPPEQVNVKAIREGLGLTQAVFAARFGLSLFTLRNWEQGKRQPDQASRAYLTVIERYPEEVRQALRANQI